MEKWMPIKGYPDYFVSSNGEIKSFKNNKEHILKPLFDGQKAYLHVSLCNKEGRKTKQIHRLVATAFLPNPLNKKQVNHKNLNKEDNRVSNLEWVTQAENMKHAYKNGRVSVPSFKGNFGKNHNKSVGYILLNPNGEKEIYYSGCEFRRKTGLDNSNLTWVSLHSKKKLPHLFKKGKIKGYTLLETFSSYIGRGNKNTTRVKEINYGMVD